MSLGLVRATLAATAALFAAAGPASAAPSVVNVTLWDKGADAGMSTDAAYPATDAVKAAATDGIRLSRKIAAAGEITFKVTNSSKDMIHEMIVVLLSDPGNPLPYIADENRVDEDKVGDKGEVSELDPGKSGALTVTLAPGSYLLICNVPGHFAAGMWTEFTVVQ